MICVQEVMANYATEWLEKLNTTRAHNETLVAINLLTQSHTNTTGY